MVAFKTKGRATAEVEAALSKLVSSGKVSAKTGPDGQLHYYVGCKGQ
jgi:hypothetical protein